MQTERIFPWMGRLLRHCRYRRLHGSSAVLDTTATLEMRGNAVETRPSRQRRETCCDTQAIAGDDRTQKNQRGQRR